METNKRRICRLCFKVSRSNYEPIDEIKLEMLNVLLVKVNVSISANPVICGECIESIWKFFEFKSTCFYTQDHLIPFVVSNSGAKLDLMEICLGGNTTILSDSDNVACRFCMQCSAREQHVTLDVLKESYLKDMVLQCVPEVDLTITQEFMICTVCMEYLTNYSNFITSCCDTEKQIMNYCSAESIINQVNLNDVRQFVLRNKSYDVAMVKTEEVTIKNEIDVDSEQDDSSRLSEPQSSSQRRKSTSTRKPSNSKRSYKCDLCTYKAKRKEHLQKHMVTHKHPAQKEYKCKLCEYECAHKDYLRVHMIRHKSVGSYPCDNCSFVSKSKVALRKHKHYKHSTGLPQFQCAECPYKTVRKSSLRVHVLTHMDRWKAVRFKCDLCAFATTRHSTLLDHQVLHKDNSEVTIYKCNKCPYQCKLKQYIRNHMLKHDTTPETKQFKCELCTYRSKSKRHLKVHMQTHQNPSERKLYRCDMCEYKCKMKSNLKYHIFWNHKNQDDKREFYKCYLCSFQTKEKNTLKHHIFNKHMISKTRVAI